MPFIAPRPTKIRTMRLQHQSAGPPGGAKAPCSGRVGVGTNLLGWLDVCLHRRRRVVELGSVQAGGLAAERFDPIERPAPGIVERDLITEPMLTGLTLQR